MLISKHMREQNRLLHEAGGYGGSGYKSAADVDAFARTIGAKTILDYGCGEGTLRRALIADHEWHSKRVLEYDPAIDGKASLPDKPVDLVVCTDVLEHVELDCLSDVTSSIFRLAVRGAYLTIATRDGNKKLPCGTNAHLTVMPATWWRKRMTRDVEGFFVWRYQEQRYLEGGPYDCRFWMVRQ